jgi:hypothetical protein
MYWRGGLLADALQLLPYCVERVGVDALLVHCMEKRWKGVIYNTVDGGFRGYLHKLVLFIHV